MIKIAIVSMLLSVLVQLTYQQQQTVMPNPPGAIQQNIFQFLQTLPNAQSVIITSFHFNYHLFSHFVFSLTLSFFKF